MNFYQSFIFLISFLTTFCSSIKIYSQDFPLSVEFSEKNKVELKEDIGSIHLEEFSKELYLEIWSSMLSTSNGGIYGEVNATFQLSNFNLSATENLKTDKNTTGTRNFIVSEKLLNPNEIRNPVKNIDELYSITVAHESNPESKLVVDSINLSYAFQYPHSHAAYLEREGQFAITSILHNKVRLIWVNKDLTKTEKALTHQYEFNNENRLLTAYLTPESNDQQGKLLLLICNKIKNQPASFNLVHMTYNDQGAINSVQKPLPLTKEISEKVDVVDGDIYWTKFKDGELESVALSYTHEVNYTGGGSKNVGNPIMIFENQNESYTQKSEIHYTNFFNKVKFVGPFRGGFITISCGAGSQYEGLNPDLSDYPEDFQSAVLDKENLFPHIQIAYVDMNNEVHYKILPVPGYNEKMIVYKQNNPNAGDPLSFILMFYEYKGKKLREFTFYELKLH